MFLQGRLSRPFTIERARLEKAAPGLVSALPLGWSFRSVGGSASPFNDIIKPFVRPFARKFIRIAKSNLPFCTEIYLKWHKC